MVTLEQLNEIAAMLSEHDSADDDETLRVSVQSMAKLLAELYHLRRQVTELQAHNTARQERARAAAQEREETRAALAVETKNANAYAHERDEARAECERMRLERDEALAKLEEGAADVVPPELARLWKAAHGARGHFGAIKQQVKLVEECGEYVAEYMRTGERFSEARVMAEAHDVLTVALSLAEPALMAKAAERLEGRLAE